MSTYKVYLAKMVEDAINDDRSADDVLYDLELAWDAELAHRQANIVSKRTESKQFFQSLQIKG